MFKSILSYLDKIECSPLAQFVDKFFLDCVPKYFFEIPASSSGKYHPAFDNGIAGLTRHSIMVVEVGLSMLKRQEYKDVSRDEFIVAALLHDSFKNGHIDTGHTVNSHPIIAADELLNYYNRNATSFPEVEVESIQRIANAISSHMGEWYRIQTKTPLDNLVALSDYIASRTFFDILKD